MALTDSGGGRTIVSHSGGVVLPQMPVKTGATIKAGDLIHLGDAGGAVRADRDAGAGPLFAHAVALNDATGGQSVCFIHDCIVKFPAGDGTRGAKVHASGTAGRYIESAPGVGDAKNPIGRVIDASAAAGDVYTLVSISCDPTGTSDATA